ncbi:hypothetical protein J2S59_000930 [Nocardioides massiliensis]|uniref:DUF2804 domain-containing protein n=2 Tax=Nocardioides massiliensis TaxID=1325935 RepID=A0ABT9NL25_9ACTN|nr:DUF2804 domain-containing protein [Nocardioides massiliensis]MDP9821121.1 hypothetical protein [Nocardioides massiliensis]
MIPEITAPVALLDERGRLNRAAVGWTRTPLHDTSGVARRRGWRPPVAWGRNKRWEYWAVITPTHVVALVVSSIDYAAVHGIFCLDRRTGAQIAHDAIGVLGGSARLPGSLGGGPARGRTRAVRTEVEETPDGTRLRAEGARVSLDVVVPRPADHEAMGVVVPWSDRLVQYTVKDVGRTAYGRLIVDGEEVAVSEADSWAVHDHGRGRWPYDIAWNWGAGGGRVDGRVIGVQLGARWTAGTGSTENALYVDGRLTKIHHELDWRYTPGDWLAAWEVRGEGVELTFTPEHLRRAVTDLTVFFSKTHQVFGTWAGRVRDADGAWVEVREVYGFAEDVHNRW